MLRCLPPRHHSPSRRAPGVAAVCLAALALAACDPVSLAFTGASAVSAVGTSKTIPDHVMSFATGEECTYHHQLAGEAWCQPVPAEVAGEPMRYCYDSIATTTCYAVENPYETRSRRVP